MKETRRNIFRKIAAAGLGTVGISVPTPESSLAPESQTLVKAITIADLQRENLNFTPVDTTAPQNTEQENNPPADTEPPSLNDQLLMNILLSEIPTPKEGKTIGYSITVFGITDGEKIQFGIMRPGPVEIEPEEPRDIVLL